MRRRSSIPAPAGTAPAGRGVCWPRSPSSWRRRACWLREGTIVDATILDAPASTKNRAQARDPEMHQVRRATSGTSDEGAYRGRRGHGTGAQPATTAANVGISRKCRGSCMGPRRACGATPAMRRGPAPEHRGGGSTGRWRCGRGSGGAWRPAAPPPRRSNARPRFERRWSIHFSM